MIKNIFTLFIVFFSSCYLQAQTISYTPTNLGAIPNVLSEASGLLFYDSALWSINDGGNSATLYKMDTTAPYNILQTFVLENISNIDWEALSQDETHFYIGDFGNNFGNRRDLRILKFPKTELNTNPPSIVDTIHNIEFINFSYSDQTDFTSALNNNNFDCEAFIYFEDSLYLFSKNWLNNQTKVYTIPNQAGDYTAILKDSFNTDFLVTDASVDSSSNNLILIGYNGNNGSCFAYTIKNFYQRDFFSGTKQRFSLPHVITSSQIEGVTLFNHYSGWIVGENFTFSSLNVPATLHWFDFSDYLSNNEQEVNLTILNTKNLVIYPNPIEKAFQIDFSFLEKGIWHLQFFTINGILVYEDKVIVTDNLLHLELPHNVSESGFYLLKIHSEKEHFTFKIQKK